MNNRCRVGNVFLLPTIFWYPNFVCEFIQKGATFWAGENVTDRITECDPVFVPPHFFDLKISHLQNAGEQK